MAQMDDARERSKGSGGTLVDWLVDYARAHGCASLQLDSGIQGTEAHRFCFRQWISVGAFHVVMPLPTDQPVDTFMEDE